MSTRVLSTDEAKASIGRIKGILDEGLASQIKALRSEGDILSQPDIWDGSLANQFRSDAWPSASSALGACQAALETLRAQVETITGDILAAGGNG
jgi:uncharacterized protein YukE